MKGISRKLLLIHKTPFYDLVSHEGHALTIQCNNLMLSNMDEEPYVKADKDIPAGIHLQLICLDCHVTISEDMSAIQVNPGTLVTNRFPILDNPAYSMGLCLKAYRIEDKNDTVYPENCLIIMANGKTDNFSKDDFQKYFIIKGIHPGFIKYQLNEEINQQIADGLFNFLK